MNNDIVGTQIGIYNVLYECDYKTNDGHKKYHVKCTQCGFETDMRKTDIKKPKVCNHKNRGGFYINYKATFQNQRIHTILKQMRDRCYNPKCEDYKWYGGKGIKIYEEWLSNSPSFEKWALENGYEDNLTIDRINENKDYCPENCRWISLEDNVRYKSTTRLLEVDGEVHSGKEWDRILGLTTNTINTYVRTQGIEDTINFIKKIKNNVF